MGVAVQSVSPVGAALQVINYLDVTTPTFSMANKDILGYWPVAVPPSILQADNTVVVNQEVVPHSFEFKGRKRLERIHQGVFLTPLADASDLIQGFFQARLLLRFSA